MFMIVGFVLRKKALKIQLTSWIFLLTATAGFMNVVTIILFSATSSHHTGSLSNSMIHLVKGDFEGFIRLIIVILAFFLGTMLSGFLFPEQVFKLKRRYGYIQLLSGLAILAGSIMLKDPWWRLLETTLILGLQNGMFVYYKGMIVRTTHMSGNLTDAGLALGRSLAGRKSELWKARFQLLNLSFFLLGSIVGAGVLLYTSVDIWLVASSLYFFLGLLYFSLYHHVNYAKSIHYEFEINGKNLFDYLK